MDSGDLRIFHVVAREGSITRAAHVLGYVQSNVTARIQQLELELKTQLFYRQRGMILTPDGETLLSYTERILHLLDEAQKALTDSNDPAGRLSLGSNSKVAALHLPKILAQYYNQYPAVNLSLITDKDEELIRKVRHFQLDAAFVKTAVVDENIVEELVFQEDLVLITSPGEFELKSLPKKPFLMNSVGCVYRAKLENWLASEGVSDIRFMEFNQLDAILEGVAAGLGSSLVPETAAERYVSDGLVNCFTVPQQYRATQTYLIRHKDSLMTRALVRFIQMVQEQIPIHG